MPPLLCSRQFQSLFMVDSVLIVPEPLHLGHFVSHASTPHASATPSMIMPPMQFGHFVFLVMARGQSVGQFQHRHFARLLPST